MADVTNQELPLAAGCPRAKAEGAFIALAAGDALGWPQEFRSKPLGANTSSGPTAVFRTWARRGGGRFYPHEEIIRRGEYSDDTQLTLAVARSRLYPGTCWWTVFTRSELPLWTLYERGGGGATKRAADLWVRGTAPWKSGDPGDVRRYFEAGGNGVAMRVLPHTILHGGTPDPTNLIRDVLTDGVATHGHPRALVGATAYAYAAWWLLRVEHTVRFGELAEQLASSSAVWGALPTSGHAKNGWMEAANHHAKGGYEALWHGVVTEMRELIGLVSAGIDAGALGDDIDVLRRLGCFGKTKGSGTISTAAAVYLSARYAAQPVQAVLSAAFAKGADTDTVAAMTGGLMGCLAGSDWLPQEWFGVQDSAYLRRLANAVAQGAPHGGVQKPTPRPIGEKDLSALRAALAEPGESDLDLDGTRLVRVVDLVALKSLSKATVAQAWQLETSDGQTIYVTKLGRGPKKEPERRDSKPLDDPSIPPGQARTAAMPETRAVGIKLTVADVSASASFYERALGLVPIRKTQKFVSYGALSLVEARYAVDLSGGAVRLDQPNGRNRIEIHVSDMDAVQRRLAEHQVHPTRPVAVMSWGDRSLHVTDPDGNVVELVERRGR